MRYEALRAKDDCFIKESDNLDECLEGVQSYVNNQRVNVIIYKDGVEVVTLRPRVKKKYNFDRVQVMVKVHVDDRKAIQEMAMTMNLMRIEQS